MRLSVRLTLALVGAAVIPLVAGAVMWLDVGKKALEEQVRAAQRTAAERVADGATQWIGETLGRMRLSADIFDLHGMETEARVGALRIVYWQLEEAPIVALLDETGAPVAPAVYRRDGEVEEGRLPASDEEVGRFLRHVPMRTVLDRADGFAVGEAYLDSRRHAVMVPVAVRVEGRATDPMWVLAAELALRPLQTLVGRLPHRVIGTAYLVDGENRILAHPDGRRLLQVSSTLTKLHAGEGGLTVVNTVDGESGETYLVAAAALQGFPWHAIVEQSEASAFRAVRATVRQTTLVLGVSLLMALVIGAVLARGISLPIIRASGRARAIAAGDLSGRLAESGGGEVRDLAVAFNAMAEEIERSRREIEGFNRELQERVAERTAELRKAQGELLQSRKMAAVGELGAGVAHELNNPLTGILGITQLILRKRQDDDPELKLLRRIEADAKRCREITMNLLRFSEQGDAVVLVEADVDAIAKSALDLQAALLHSRGINVEKALAGDLPKVKADAAHLQQALLNLLSNAGNATPEGGTVRLETGVEEAFVFVSVLDTGRGIHPSNLDRIWEPFFTTKDDWRGAGLGLSVAYRIVDSHNGTIGVDSKEGEGSTFTIRLPIPSGTAKASTVA